MLQEALVNVFGCGVVTYYDEGHLRVTEVTYIPSSPHLFPNPPGFSRNGIETPSFPNTVVKNMNKSINLFLQFALLQVHHKPPPPAGGGDGGSRLVPVLRLKHQVKVGSQGRSDMHRKD